MLFCGISRFKRYNFQAGNKSESAEFLDDDDSLPEKKTGPNDASGTESLGSFPSLLLNIWIFVKSSFIVFTKPNFSL